jgi:hypothetical protein
MKALFFVCIGFLFFSWSEQSKVSYFIENNTDDTLFADVWINGSCFDMIRKDVLPHSKTELYCDNRIGKAKEQFLATHENLIGSLYVCRYADIKNVTPLLFSDSLVADAVFPLDLSKGKTWTYHKRVGNKGVAVMKFENADLIHK